MPIRQRGRLSMKRWNLMLAGGVLALAFPALLTAVDAPPAASKSIPPPGNPTAGARVFATSGCGGCHTLAAAGARGSVGPNLDVTRPTFQKVVLRVTQGRGIMPSFKGRLTTKQIQDVAAYIVAVAGQRGHKPTPVPTTRPRDGRQLFQLFCGSCHSLKAAGTTGTKGPNLDAAQPDANQVIDKVVHGGDGMPSFKNTLSQAENKAIASFVARATNGNDT
jgi:cbb3-type cytochrome c oxidase subunit III